MKIKCDYCENYIDNTDEICPNCGAANKLLVKKDFNIPKNIEELKKWYQDNDFDVYNLSRFFIDKDYKKPNATGIYKDPEKENYIIYKNDDNGTRIVRYEGKDEAYAVKEFYFILKENLSERGNFKSKKYENTIVSHTDLIREKIYRANVTCEYCGKIMDSTSAKCSNCGGINKGVVRNAIDVPNKIAELKRWCMENNLSDESVTKIFVDKNVVVPDSFGIYKDNENFIVYSNDRNGIRSIHYKGKDETYAVYEVYLKLRQKNIEQKSRYSKEQSLKRYLESLEQHKNKPIYNSNEEKIILVAFAVFLLTSFILMMYIFLK